MEKESRFLLLPDQCFVDASTLKVVSVEDLTHGSRQVVVYKDHLLELSVMERPLGSFIVNEAIHSTRFFFGFFVFPFFSFLLFCFRNGPNLRRDGAGSFVCVSASVGKGPR
jgi:hypothetical protein